MLTSYGFVSKRLENVVLIDTRGPEAAGKGHIEGAFSIPLDKLAKEKDQFPLDTKVPIILYGQDTALAEISPVMEELSLWLDHKLFILEDGYAGWVKKGGPVQSEKIRTKIVYLPKPG